MLQLSGRSGLGGVSRQCPGAVDAKRGALCGLPPCVGRRGSHRRCGWWPRRAGRCLSEELKAAIILFYSLLDERQRRLYAGLEAHKVGYGGDHKIAEFLGLDVHTVARGRREAAGGRGAPATRAPSRRRAQGSRKKKPAVIEAIAHLLRHETGGDPMRDLKMVPPARLENRRPTTSSADSGQRQYRTSLVETDGIQLAGESQAAGIGNKNPPPRRVRNRQFTYIDRQRKQRFTARAHPIISVDAKKKEWIGKFKNSGISWEQQPQLVNDHYFPSDAVGRAIPYGVYDPRRNQGFVVVGTSRETPAFAVDAITLWWKSCGQRGTPTPSNC